MVVLGVIGVVITVLGLRTPSEKAEETVEAPLAQNVLQKFGIAATGISLGVIQSGTSAPFAGGMVLISLHHTPAWLKVVHIVMFAIVAILPSVALIALVAGELRRRRGRHQADRQVPVLRRVAGRVLTLVVGVALMQVGRCVQLSDVVV